MVTLKLSVHLVIRSIINTFNRTNLEEHYQGRGKEARRINLLCLLLSWTELDSPDSNYQIHMLEPELSM